MAAELFSGIYKDDKLTPVISLVIYNDGENEWDGSKSLYEMIDWGDEPELVLDIEKYMSDFQVNLLSANELGKYENFDTSLQYIFGMLKYSKDKNGLRKYIEDHKQELDALDEVEATAAFAFLGQHKMVESLLDKDSRAKKEDFKMCRAITEWMEEERMIGEVRGEAKGEARINILTQKLLLAGRQEDLIRSTHDPAFQKQLLSEYNIV